MNPTEEFLLCAIEYASRLVGALKEPKPDAEAKKNFTRLVVLMTTNEDHYRSRLPGVYEAYDGLIQAACKRWGITINITKIDL